MAFTAYTLEEMNQFQADAFVELTKLDPKAVETLATWWKAWYMKAGHKRLGRALMTTLPKS